MRTDRAATAISKGRAGVRRTRPLAAWAAVGWLAFCAVVAAVAPATAAAQASSSSASRPDAEAATAALPSSAASAAAPTTRIEVFVREGCPHCAEAEKFLAVLAAERPDVDIVIRDVSKEDAAMARLQEISRDHPQAGPPRVPAFHVGGQLLFGYSTEASSDQLIRSALRGVAVAGSTAASAGDDGSCALNEASTCKLEVPPEESFSVEMFGRTVTLDDVGLPAFTIAMGLLDGLNPCSMWVLILMISLLATLNDRKRMLAVAGTFVLVEGIAYFVFMAAWLNLFLLIGLSKWSQWLIAAIAIFAGLLNVKDFYRPGTGPSLSISDKRKPGIYSRMRAVLHAKNLPAAIGGVIVLALLVQIVEFLCTSGFPALFTRILTLRALDTASYYGYLLLYNLAYMFDDIVVLAIGVVTLSNRRLQEKEGRWLKLLSGVVMIGLGVYLLAT